MAVFIFCLGIIDFVCLRYSVQEHQEANAAQLSFGMEIILQDKLPAVILKRDFALIFSTVRVAFFMPNRTEKGSLILCRRKRI